MTKLRFAAAAIIFFAAFVTITTPAAQAATCTVGSVAGSYGYTTTGTVFVSGGPFQVAAVGVANFDLQGNVSGKQTRVVAGTATDETISGTFTVNPDCTGNTTVTVQPGGRVSTIDIVWVDNAKQIHAVFTSAGTVLT